MDSDNTKYRVMMTVLLGLVLSGTSYVWRHFPYIARGWMSLLIKIIASVRLGWVITPVTLIYRWIEVKVYEGKLKRQQRMEYEEEKKADTDQV